MTYSTATTQKFTLIDNLPDLDDLEENKVGDKYNKFIRNNHSPTPMQAGMSSPQDHAMALDTEPMAILAAKPRNFNKSVGPGMGHEGMGHEGMGHPGMGTTTPVFEAYKNSNLTNGPSCIDVAEHIAICPLCSKFYKSDNTIYTVTIVILVIICLILLKKVLDV